MSKQWLNDALDQLDFQDIYRTHHLTNGEYILFSSADEMFSRIDYMLGHKASLKNLRELKLYFIQQYYETRNQSQEENWEKRKHMETKQYITKKQTG